jgi:hypothetical protein
VLRLGEGRILQGNAGLEVGDGQWSNRRYKRLREWQSLLKSVFRFILGRASPFAHHLLLLGKVTVEVQRLVYRLVVLLESART